MRSQRHSVAWLIAGSTLVHLLLLLVVHQRTGTIAGFAFRSLDSREYHQIARNVARYGTFSSDAASPPAPDTWRTPGYPLFLAAIVWTLGDRAASLVVAQQMLAILNVILLYHACRSHLAENRALTASLLFLVEPYHLYYSTWLLATTLFTSVLLLSWLAWQAAIRRPGWRTAAVLGACCGAAVLVRPIAVLVPGVVLLGLAVHLRRSPSRSSGTGLRQARSSWNQPLVGIGSFVLACGAIVSVWVVRNGVVAGHFALSDQSGVVLAYFKATEIALWEEGRANERYLETSLDERRRDSPHRTWESIDVALRAEMVGLSEHDRRQLQWQNLAQGNRTAADSFDVSKSLRRIGWSVIAKRPVAALTCCALRCVSILTFPLEQALWPPKGVAAHRGRSAALGLLYALLTAAAVLGLSRCSLGFGEWFFPVAMTASLLLATTPQLDPRFRVPMIPFLAFLCFFPRRRRTSDHVPLSASS